MAELTTEQRTLLADGRALVCHCPECHVDYFLGELPMDVSDMVKLTRKAKCGSDPKHKLIMGPMS